MSDLLWPTILLLGKNGQVGWELQRTLASLGKVISFDQPELDLTKPDQIREKVRQIKPHIIVNAAAYTSVDKAEEEPELALAINGIAPGILAEEAKRIQATLVHYSTDYVFDGTKIAPYSEEDESNPINVYGKTKLAGELAIQAIDGDYLIFRTSWVYGIRGNNFLLTVLRLAKERDELRIVNDQIGAPTWCRMIAECTALILSKGSIHEKKGLYNLTTGGETSWYDFAGTILQYSRNDSGETTNLMTINSKEYGALAKRPSNSLLSNKKIQEQFGLKLPMWDETLKLMLQDYQAK